MKQSATCNWTSLSSGWVAVCVSEKVSSWFFCADTTQQRPSKRWAVDLRGNRLGDCLEGLVNIVVGIQGHGLDESRRSCISLVVNWDSGLLCHRPVCAKNGGAITRHTKSPNQTKTAQICGGAKTRRPPRIFGRGLPIKAWKNGHSFSPREGLDSWGKHALAFYCCVYHGAFKSTLKCRANSCVCYFAQVCLKAPDCISTSAHTKSEHTL